MAITTTPLGFKKPDGTELVRGGDNAIADNAQTANDLLAAAQASIALANARLGQMEANNNAGGGGANTGLTEDPANPGTYFMAETSPITADLVNPGLYNF